MHHVKKKKPIDQICVGCYDTKSVENDNKGDIEMALLQEWRDTAYSQEMDQNTVQQFWGTYFELEKGIYEQLLANPDEEVKGTVKELAAKYGIEVFTMTGF